MSATYNWAYKPGVINKYGINIAASADNVQPDNTCYVALFGNDTTGNGSRELPFRTLTKALTIGVNIIIAGSGVYREAATQVATICDYKKIYGDGDVKIDISYIGNFVASNYSGGGLFNIEVIGNGFSTFANNAAISNSTLQDVVFNGAFISPSGTNDAVMTNCIIKNYSNYLFLSWYGANGGSAKNCTFVNCNNFVLAQTDVSNGKVDSCIFYNCNISAADQGNGGLGKVGFTRFIYTLFFQCNFNVTGGTGTGGVLYPGVPNGYTYYTDIASLQADYRTAFGSNSFQGCLISNPLFNNYNIADYSLQFGSPARNLSYFGTYAGARSVAYPVTVSAAESTGGFDFSTIVNLSIADNSITLLNPSQNGSIQTTLLINNSGRQLARLPLYGFNADRNGQYIDSISDLSGSVQQAGDTLTIPTPYVVETGSITYNGIVYQPGDRLTTVEDVTSFSSDFGGTLREITEAPERHSIMMRCGNGGDAVTAGAPLAAGYWYYVNSGSITYNGTTYGGGQSFKASGSGGFSGSGNVITALGPESFNHYEPGIQPTTNNEGDARTGAILRGNGDPAYVRGGYGVQEFPINARFIQLYFIINVANLKP